MGRRNLNTPPPGYKFDEASVRRGRGGRLVKIPNTNRKQKEVSIKKPIIKYLHMVILLNL